MKKTKSKLVFNETKDNNVFQLLFKGVSEGVLVVDKNQIIQEVNQATEEMFGYNKGELMGKHLNILIPSKVHDKHHEYFRLFIEKGESRKMGAGRDLFGIKKDGSKFPVEAGLNPFTFEGKNYVMSLISDISLRKQSEEQIEQLNADLEKKVRYRTEELQQTVEKLYELNTDLEKEVVKRKRAEEKMKTSLEKERELNELKTKFLSLVSHEFKTPLSGILTSAALAGKYTQEEQQNKREKHLLTIKNKVKYLTAILNDFLSIERLESGKATYKFEDFSLQALINEVIYNANVTLKSGQVILYPKTVDECLLHQDKGVVELVLSNLLGNAIKYSPEDAQIHLKVTSNQGKLFFSIKDEGIGIPQKDQKHIFERYFRAENALLNQGTGIGLNISKVHLENLGGKVYFESKVNKGTTFFIEIPIHYE